METHYEIHRKKCRKFVFWGYANTPDLSGSPHRVSPHQIPPPNGSPTRPVTEWFSKQEGLPKWDWLLELKREFSSVDIKGHLSCKQCLHDLQFIKTRSSSPNLSKLARADISCQFMKTRSLWRHCLQKEWTLVNDLFMNIVIMCMNFKIWTFWLIKQCSSKFGFIEN